LTVEIVTGMRRFEALLKGGFSFGAEHDRPLLARPKWLVAPTIGAIVPNWLLLIPRDPVLNFQMWADLHSRSPTLLLEDVRLHLGLRADEIIWFEHGPHSAGTSVGCGLDHAHIHILIRPSFSFETFTNAARSLSGLEWSADKCSDAYQTIDIEHSYLVAGSGGGTIVTQDVEAAGSQFFRRVVAALANAEGAWDYRRFPHVHHVSQTIRTFRSLESVVRRGQ
jgi:ATP adenylyltransferase